MRIWFVALVLVCLNTEAQKPDQPTSSEIKAKLQKLGFLGSVLYVAAHPDDENTRVITYMAKDRMAAAAYLSMTRGDGGQNLIGPEIGDKLGLIRTQELLAARRIDGGEQFFTRAVDFGFSKSADETLEIWGKDAVLADVVKVYRQFQPDIILTRFPADERAGHGHHTSSAILAAEAFDKAGDVSQYPQSANAFGVWTPGRLYTNTGRWWNTTINESTPGIVTLDVGAYSPLLGMSASERAAVSRSQHKSQGFGSRGTRGYQPEYFEFVKGEQAKSDFFEGINTTWSRLTGGEKVQPLIDEVVRTFDESNPAASVELLMKIRKQILSLNKSVWKDRKLKELDDVLADCMGLYVEVTASAFWGVPGEPLQLTTEVVNRSNEPLRLRKVSSKKLAMDTTFQAALEANKLLLWSNTIVVDRRLDFTGPYWLQQEHKQGLFTVTDSDLIGQAESNPAATVDFMFELAGEEWTLTRPVVYRWTDPVDGELYRPFEIVPKVTIEPGSQVLVIGDGASKSFSAKVVSNGKLPFSGKVSLKVPSGWSYSPIHVDVNLQTAGSQATCTFTLVAPADESMGTLEIVVESNDEKYTRSLQEIKYDHIPAQILLSEAKVQLVRLAIKKEGNLIGYIKGAGDEMPNSLRAMGYEVWELNSEDITAENLNRCDAIVFGVRALNTNEQLRTFNPTVLEYARNGGTVIYQYNTSQGLVTKDFSPYSLTLSRNRVTEEDAAVTFLTADHPVLNSPNKILQKDFEGWIQERGLYFPNAWDPAFTPILRMNDTGEDPQDGSLLVAKYGDGYFVYTGLAFFRQLPQGVPGAYKLFANMVSLGKPATDKLARNKQKKNK